MSSATVGALLSLTLRNAVDIAMAGHDDHQLGRPHLPVARSLARLRTTRRSARLASSDPVFVGHNNPLLPRDVRVTSGNALRTRSTDRENRVRGHTLCLTHLTFSESGTPRVPDFASFRPFPARPIYLAEASNRRRFTQRWAASRVSYAMIIARFDGTNLGLVLERDRSGLPGPLAATRHRQPDLPS